VVASILTTVGELSRVAGPSMRAHLGDVLPLIIDAIQDPSATLKRTTAVATLGQVLAAPGALDPKPKTLNPCGAWGPGPRELHGAAGVVLQALGP
jgi:hypothetical protein